jgi:hypothetical protein
MSRERDILAAELRSSTAEFLGWLTGLKPPSDQEAIPVEMRPAFEKMCNRLALAAEQYAAPRIEALEAALITEWAARDNRIEALEAEVARLNSIIEKMLNAEAARIEALEAALREIKDQYLTPQQSSAIAKAALAPEQDKP